MEYALHFVVWKQPKPRSQQFLKKLSYASRRESQVSSYLDDKQHESHKGKASSRASLAIYAMRCTTLISSSNQQKMKKKKKKKKKEEQDRERAKAKEKHVQNNHPGNPSSHITHYVISSPKSTQAHRCVYIRQGYRRESRIPRVKCVQRPASSIQHPASSIHYSRVGYPRESFLLDRLLDIYLKLLACLHALALAVNLA